jgi:splicing factor 3B subunit 2
MLLNVITDGLVRKNVPKNQVYSIPFLLFALITSKSKKFCNFFQAMLAKEDLSDMVAEHAAKQSSKRKRQVGKEENKSGKKYKEFKF